MARYDREWRHPQEAYDGGYRRRRGFGAGPRGNPAAGFSRLEMGYDRGYGSPADVGAMERFGGFEDEASDGIYGPARYGLGPYYERLRNRRRPDDELREEVEEALFYDTWVDAEAITVEVDDGVVTLRGELPSYEEIRYATDDAWDVEGVRGVRSELTVREGAGA